MLAGDEIFTNNENTFCLIYYNSTKTIGVHSFSDTCHSSCEDILYISIINTKFQSISTSVYTNKNIPVINICFTTLKIYLLSNKSFTSFKSHVTDLSCFATPSFCKNSNEFLTTNRPEHTISHEQ